MRLTERLHARTTHTPTPVDGARPSAAASIPCACGRPASVRTDGNGVAFGECVCGRKTAIPRIHLNPATRWAAPIASPYDEHPRRRGGSARLPSTPKVCTICETIYERQPRVSLSDWARQTTCSGACARISKSRRMKAYNAAKRNRSRADLPNRMQEMLPCRS